MITVGDKVKDKFKKPRCNDESVYGLVTNITEHEITVEMETGIARKRVLPKEYFWNIFEKEK